MGLKRYFFALFIGNYFSRRHCSAREHATDHDKLTLGEIDDLARVVDDREAERAQLIKGSSVAGTYAAAVDRESAYEKLKVRAEQVAQEKSAAAQPQSGAGSVASDILFCRTGPRGGRQQGILDAMAKSAARTVGSQVGRELIRGILGSLLGSKRR